VSSNCRAASGSRRCGADSSGLIKPVWSIIVRKKAFGLRSERIWTRRWCGGLRRLAARSGMLTRTGTSAETVHCMNKSKQAFRLVVIRRPVQGDLFGGPSATEKYTAIATNRTEKP